jgi:uncharacterized protein (DUF58 family)
MIRPTARAVMLYMAGVPLALFFVIADPERWQIAVYYGMLALLITMADAALAFPARALTLRVITPDRIFIGETGAARIEIEAARHRRPTAFETVLDLRGETAPARTIVATLPPGEPASAEFAIEPTRRGRVWVDRAWIRWQGPLALTRFTATMAVEKAIDVVPNIAGVQKSQLQAYVNEAIFGIKVQQRGEGVEFEALREYQPGFDIRHIDWKSSARLRKLLCKEFRTERNHHVVMAFDTGRLMLEPIAGLTRLDHAINAALRLAWVSLQSGDLVGVYGFDAGARNYVAPLRGSSAFARLQKITAELEYHHQETNFTLGLAELHSRLKRRALVILFTDFVDTITAELLIESMTRMAGRHVVVFVTMQDALLRQTIDAPPDQFEDVARAVIANDFLHERSVVLERLSRLGVHCLDVPANSLSIGLINRYLQIKQRGLI